MMHRTLLALLAFFSFCSASALQDAIDGAEAGSLIRLSAGVYEGNIVIDKPIRIEGQEKGAVIQGDGTGTVVIIKSPFVTLRNLTIRGSGERHDTIDAGIRAEEANDCEISDCIIEDSLFGIDLQMVRNSVIRGNTITSKELSLGQRGDGIRLWYSNDNIIRGNHLIRSRDMVVWYSHGNTIEENRGEYGRYSLHFMYAGKNLVRNNVYEHNSVGIFFMYSKETIAEGNVIKSSLGATGMGIGLKEASGFTIRDNTLIYNSIGFYIDRSPFEPGTKNVFQNNRLLYNSEAMHFHSISENNVIKSNSFVGNIEDVVNDSKGSRTYKNLFAGNYWDSYEGFDADSDNIGDTPHRAFGYADTLWLYNPDVKFFYGSAVISMLNFLAKLAPFSEPVFLFEDKEPMMKVKG